MSLRHLKGYYNLVENAQKQNRNKENGYYESHHIIPASLGGTEDVSNRVLLTAKEHYIAHYLLTKFTKGRMYYKMVKAFDAMGMCGKNQTNNRHQTCRLFEKNRIIAAEAHSIIMTGKKQKPAHVASRAKSNTGKKRNTKTRELMSKSQSAGKNPAAYQWKIYNEFGILVEIVNGAFLKTCKERGWSQKEFRLSASENRLVYDYTMPKVSIQRLKNNGMYKFKGWKVEKTKIPVVRKTKRY